MPDGWRTCTLRDVIELKRGYDLPSTERRKGVVPIVSSSGVSGSHDKAKVTAPGVVTGRYGTIGQVFFVTEDFWPLNTTLYVRDFKGNDERFVSYFLRSLDFQSFNDKSSVPGLNRNDLHRFEVEVPSLDEQYAIADVLGSLDDKIEQNRRTGRALEKLARAIFRAWFVDFEPVHAKAAGATSFPSMPQDVFDALPERFIESEIGPIPTDWMLKPLYETAQFINGAAFKSSHFCDASEGLPVIKIAELKSGITAQTKFSKRSDLDPKYQIDTGEVLYSWSGSPDTSLDTFLWTKGKGLLNQHIFRVVTTSEAQKYFVFYLLKHLRQTLIEIARNKQTTGLGHVTVADMRRLLVCWPTSRFFDEAANQIGPIFETSFHLLVETEKLAELRDYLLPRLLSGQVRVRDAEKWVDDPESFDVAEHQSAAAAKRTRVSVQCNLTGPGDSQSGLGDDDHVQAGETRGDSVAVAEAGDEPPSMSIAGRPPVPIESWSTEEVMAAFRQAARNRGTMTREELLKRVAQRLGYQRLGSAIRERLKNHLRAALRRHIIAADGPEWVVAETTSMSDYDLDELVDVLRSVMRKGQAMQREEVIRAVAAHLGFTRLVDTVQAPIKSAINAGIRRGILQYDRNTLWRVG